MSHPERNAMQPELVKMSMEDFESMDDLSLCRACVWDASMKMRGTDNETRSRVYGSLTEGQRAVFMFWVLNARGPRGFTQLHEQLPHLVYEDSFWDGLRAAGRLVGVPELVTLTDAFLALRDQEGNEDAIAKLDAALAQLIRRELPRFSAFIRAHPGQFVQLDS
ncbi:hypothetical protein [Corallococcus caeni]